MPTPQSEDIKSKLIDCPKCHAHMVRSIQGDLQIDRCPSCHGLWLDALERERILATPKLAQKLDSDPLPAAATRDDLRVINCPRDNSPMIAVSDPKQRHVRFEQCTVCGGAFLDAGELRDLSELTLIERIRTILG